MPNDQPAPYRLGRMQTLPVVRLADHGVYLGDPDHAILLPRKQVPEGIRLGDSLEVFLYTDSEDRPIATTTRPFAQAGECAFLTVVDTNHAGAFLDWGLEKDLFLPRPLMIQEIRPGQMILVRVFVDEVSGRVTATMQVDRFLTSSGPELEVGQRVTVLVTRIMPEYTQVIVEHRFRGAIFPDERVEALRRGHIRTGYIKRIRPEDGRIAISLRPQTPARVDEHADRILAAVRANGGRLGVHDRSDPEDIYRRFGLSKSAFKRLIGNLQRQGKLRIESDHIRLPDGS